MKTFIFNLLELNFFNDLDDNAYGKYVVGQNIYGVMLKQCFTDLNFDHIFLHSIDIVWLTPFMKEGYQIIDVPILYEKTNNWLLELGGDKVVSLPKQTFYDDNSW